MSAILPISSALGDVFTWESQVTIPSNTPGQNKQTANVQVQSDSFFCLMAFMASTNYDNVAGDFIAVIGAGPAAARTLVSPPFVPNNFEVQIRYNSDLAFSDTPMPQGALVANATRAGVQLPYPFLCPPMSTFDFEFYNVAPTLLKQAGGSTAIDLVVTFGLYGYFVKLEMLAAFLACFDAYQAAARQGMPGWIRRFTNIDMPASVGL